MTRVAVVGVGAMGRNHARVYREMPDVDLVAVVDSDEDLAKHVAKIYATEAYTDLRRMIDQARPEAVSVAVPTQAHFAAAMTLLDAGCHVLVEKPIAASLEEAGELVAQAARSRRILMVGHIERYNPAVVELKRRLEMGQLGRIFGISARRLGPFPARVRDVGVVLDLATHDLDVMRYLTGSEVVRLYAETRRRVHTLNEDLFSGMLRFADDTIGVLEINWLTPTKIRELMVTGERGMFRADYLTQDLAFYENGLVEGTRWEAIDVLRGVTEGVMTRFAFARTEPLRAELDMFVGSVQGRVARCLDGSDGEKALALALALMRSAEASQAIELTPS